MVKEIKIATYNIRNSIRPKTIIRNLARMENVGVNIFCLQEVRKIKRGKFIGDKLKEKFGKKWKMKYFVKPDSRDAGLCVVWKPDVFCLVSLERLYLPKIKKLNPGIKALEKMFFNRPLPTQRGAIIADFIVKSNGKLLRIANVHLDWLGGRHKVNQLGRLMTRLNSKPAADAEIICGDFNTVGPLGLFKKRREEICEVLGKEFKDASSLVRHTSRTRQKLDYIFAKKLKFINAKRLKWRGSDHWPLMADFEC